jgi:hypothetical protein
MDEWMFHCFLLEKQRVFIQGEIKEKAEEEVDYCLCSK